MGFFSWLTQDSDESISNVYSSEGAFTVYMWDNKGNIWTEDAYEGYGEFGGKDYYELLAEMNGLKTREEGIKLSFSGERHITPNLTIDKEWEWIDQEPRKCEHQGYFYDADCKSYYL